MYVLLLIIVSLMFLLTIIRFVRKLKEIKSKRNRIKFPLDASIEEFLNTDSFGEWINVNNYFYNSMRRLTFYVQNDEILMTRDYWVHSASNPGSYFKVKKEQFISVVKA